MEIFNLEVSGLNSILLIIISLVVILGWKYVKFVFGVLYMYHIAPLSIFLIKGAAYEDCHVKYPLKEVGILGTPSLMVYGS